MNKRYCKNCYFHDKCPGCKVCENYYPLSDEAEEEMIEDEVEEQREEFRDEWNKYIRHDDNDEWLNFSDYQYNLITCLR